MENKNPTVSKLCLDGTKEVSYVPFEIYSEMFKDYFKMRREDGILEVIMDTHGGYTLWGAGIHRAWGALLQYIGADYENEVIILGAAGDRLIGGIDPKMIEWTVKNMKDATSEMADFTYDYEWIDGRAVINNLIRDIDVPTIGCYNGPTNGLSTIMTFCDLTLCADTATFQEMHFFGGSVPGDGQFLSFQHLFGQKRANYMVYTGKPVSAQEALEMGVVNEIMPREDLLPRAWELARQIMKTPREVRRLTHEMMTKPLRDVVEKDFNTHFMFEVYSHLYTAMHGKDIEKALAESEQQVKDQVKKD